MAHKCVYDIAQDAHRIITDPTLAISAAQRAYLAAYLITRSVGHVIHALSPEEIDTHGQQIAADVKRAYQEFIAPLDLPGIPNYIEPAVDSLIGNALAGVTDAGLAQIKRAQAQIEEVLAS